MKTLRVRILKNKYRINVIRKHIGGYLGLHINNLESTYTEDSHDDKLKMAKVHKNTTILRI